MRKDFIKLDIFRLDTFKRLKKTLRVSALALLLLAGAGAKVAYAYCPPCVAVFCAPLGAVYWSSYTTTVVMTFDQIFMRAMHSNLRSIVPSLTLMANQTTNNTSNSANKTAVIQDRLIAAETGQAIARARSKMAQDYVPSRLVCAKETQTNLLNESLYGANGAQRAALEAGDTLNGFLSNTSTMTEQGQVAFFNNWYDNRRQNYNNPAATGIPGEGRYGADADLDLFKAVYGKNTIETDEQYQTAQDAVKNILGNAVFDPISGPALDRMSGQTAYMNRLHHQAKLNLAAGVFFSAIERRRKHGGTQSPQAIASDAAYSSAISTGSTGVTTGLTYNGMVVASTEQGESANFDQTNAMTGSINLQLLNMYKLLEQWTAVEAVNLVIAARNEGNTRATMNERTITQ